MTARTWLSAGLLLLGAAAPAHAVDRIAFGSTAIESIHYSYSVAAAKAVNEIAKDKVNLTVIATGGAVDNLARLERRQIQMGLGTFETVYQAYKGIDKFEGRAQPKLRALWVHSSSIQAYVVRADSGVKTLADLNGRKYTAGQRGSATENMVQQILAAVDVKPDYFPATLSDAVNAVRDGRTIGYTKAGSSRSLDGTTLELRTLVPINVLSFTPDEVRKVKERFPFVTFVDLKDGEIEGSGAVTTPVQSIGEFTYSDALTDAQVEAILTGIVEGREIQAAALPEFKTLDVIQETLDNVIVPLHRGAVTFYRARGYTVPDRLIPPEMK